VKSRRGLDAAVSARSAAASRGNPPDPAVLRLLAGLPATWAGQPWPGRNRVLFPGLPLAAVMALAALLRFWQLTAAGAGGEVPHGNWTARAFAATIGVGTVGLTFVLGRRLYGAGAGLVAALLLAVMPYHVIVSREVLLDALMTMCATATLYCVVRYVETGRAGWLLAGGATMGAAILARETSVVMLGGLFAFFALTPSARMRARQLLLTALFLMAEVALWPAMLRLSGHARTSQSYLLWQMSRHPNHGTWFYFTVLPSWIGLAVLAAAAAGLIWLRKEATWRERLLLAWLIVPVAFFTLWPVKGFQYLLPICPPIAILAGRTLARPFPVPGWLTLPAWPGRRWPGLRWPARPGRLTGRQWLSRAAMGTLAAATVVSLVIPAWDRIDPSPGAPLAGGGMTAKATGPWPACLASGHRIESAPTRNPLLTGWCPARD
jgi:Dolichyl-phosphate-mannose-protein mannosyltransferase